MPYAHQGWNEAGPSSHKEEGAASAHGYGKQQQEQGRWEETGSCAALPSSILLACSGSQTPAQITGLPHHPAELLDSTHHTTTKPHLAPSWPCLLSSMHTRRQLLLPDPAPNPPNLCQSPKSYMQVAPQEHEQQVGEGVFCGSLQGPGKQGETMAWVRHRSIHY